MIPTPFYTFVDGKTEAGKITAERLNKNFDALYDMFDPAATGIGEDNIAAASKILVSDRDYTGAASISGTWEFDIFPTIPAASIPDAKLSANVPLKNGANSFSALQTFLAGIDLQLSEIKNVVIEKLASLPGGTVGRIVYNTTDNKYYGWNGSAWNQLDYVGAYTGGAIRCYSDSGLLDDGDSFKFLFKTEGASPTVKLFIQGLPYPKRFYTELAEHDHTFTGVAHSHGVTDPTHRHGVTLGSHGHGATQYALGTHTHSIGLTSGGRSTTHTHQAVTSGTSATSVDSPDHTHSISGTSGAASAKQAIESANLGSTNSDYIATGISINDQTAGGTIGNKGINAGSLSTAQKLYGKALTVQIDGTNVTAAILTATGWAVIGDGTDTHDFHVAGSGELDASAYKAYAPGYHTLEVLEPESGYGCGILVHLETS